MRLRLVITLGVLLLGAVSIARAQDESRCPEVENIPGNLIFNCSFEKGWVGIDLGEVGEGWWYFVEAGRPAFVHSTFERRHGNTAQQIWSDGEAFTAGIYQQVNVTPGVAYQAHVGWAVFASTNPDGSRNTGPLIERRIGIDPTGGTNPTSGDVLWSPSLWEDTKDSSILTVSAVAQGPVITVFVRAHNPASHGADQVFFDVVSLVVSPEQPTSTPVPSTPTSTPAPPTPTSTPVPPTPTSTPVPPTPIPTPVPPTATPTPLPPTPTFTPVPPTPTPSPTSTPLLATPAVRSAAPTPTSTATESPLSTSSPSGDMAEMNPDISLYVALGSFVLAGMLIVVTVRWWRRLS
ncbi:MAG: hypothetical protein ACE5LG_07790 [Anaerolineae bacterium]